MTSPDMFGHGAAPPAPTEYIIYHDESKEPGYWRLFLFVPVGRRAVLVGEEAYPTKEAGSPGNACQARWGGADGRSGDW